MILYPPPAPHPRHLQGLDQRSVLRRCYCFRLLSKKTRGSNHLQMSNQRQHFLLICLKVMIVSLAGIEPRRTAPLLLGNQLTELTSLWFKFTKYSILSSVTRYFIDELHLNYPLKLCHFHYFITSLTFLPLFLCLLSHRTRSASSWQQFHCIQ